MQILNGFNLIVTTQRGNERACIREVLMLAEETGAPKTRLFRTRFPGLLVGNVDGDPVLLIEKLKPLAEEDPWDFRFTQKLIPLQRNVTADVASIRDAVGDLASAVPPQASFKIVVNKRGSDLRTADIISETAAPVKRRVDLERPDWIVQIEIVDDVAGVSVIKPECVLSITKLQEDAMRKG